MVPIPCAAPILGPMLLSQALKFWAEKPRSRFNRTTGQPVMQNSNPEVDSPILKNAKLID